jgi:hypothetical protein
LWKIDNQNTAKVKNRYFTPDIMETNSEKEIQFSVQVAMDNQTIMLIESNSSEEKI